MESLEYFLQFFNQKIFSETHTTFRTKHKSNKKDLIAKSYNKFWFKQKQCCNNKIEGEIYKTFNHRMCNSIEINIVLKDLLILEDSLEISHMKI